MPSGKRPRIEPGKVCYKEETRRVKLSLNDTGVIFTGEGSRPRLRGILLCLGLSLLTATASVAADASGQPKGLYVRGGTLMREGKPYFGIGANYDTLFGRILRDKDNKSSLGNLGLLAAKGIPFVRFRACGFWPQACQLYLNDREEYFRRMDLVVRSAEQHHIGLIPSLFWRLATFAELAGDPRSRLGDPKSKVSEFIKQYTREMVTRYKDSPAIWGWEFGNEANNGVDLPRSRKGRREVAESGSELDEETEGGARLTSAQLAAAYTTFAQTVRSIDPSRVIETGTTVPRYSAWHNAHGQPWKRDSAAQSYSMLLKTNPDPVNMLSVHIYQKTQKLAPYGPETLSQFVGRYAQVAAEAGKPLFIGEFPTRTPAQAAEYIRAIEDNHVPLAAFWVFDNSMQEKVMNVTFDNSRSFVLDLIAKANQNLQKAR